MNDRVSSLGAIFPFRVDTFQKGAKSIFDSLTVTSPESVCVSLKVSEYLGYIQK